MSFSSLCPGPQQYPHSSYHETDRSVAVLEVWLLGSPSLAVASMMVPVECSASSPPGRHAPIQYAAATEGTASALMCQLVWGFLEKLLSELHTALQASGGLHAA